MSRGKYEAKRKSFSVLTVVLIALLVVTLTPGGAVAYLAKASNSSVTNTFETALAPSPQVELTENGYCVNVGNPGYAVYVRAVVIPNWKQNGEVLPLAPGSFTLTVGSEWIKHADGFYYYTKPIVAGLTSPIITHVASSTESSGSLEVDIAVQVIQALGTTDGQDEQTAVFDAWGVQP